MATVSLRRLPKQGVSGNHSPARIEVPSFSCDEAVSLLFIAGPHCNAVYEGRHCRIECSVRIKSFECRYEGLGRRVSQWIERAHFRFFRVVQREQQTLGFSPNPAATESGSPVLRIAR
jgi:hypothetical protein